MCCKDCARREIGCHASCGEYANYRAVMETAKAKRRHEQNLDFIANRGELIRRSARSGR